VRFEFRCRYKRDNVWIREAVGDFEGFALEHEDVEAGFVAVYHASRS